MNDCEGDFTDEAETCVKKLDENQSLVDGETSTKVRSRLVAREIKQKGTDSYFAGTPPLTRTLRDKKGCDEIKNG